MKQPGRVLASHLREAIPRLSSRETRTIGWLLEHGRLLRAAAQMLEDQNDEILRLRQELESAEASRRFNQLSADADIPRRNP